MRRGVLAAGIVFLLVAAALATAPFADSARSLSSGPKAATNTTSCSTPTDTDCDGVANSVDNCPTLFNPDQRDYNHNGIGDRCDPSPFPQSYSEVMFYPRSQSGGLLTSSQKACFHYQWSANANVSQPTGDGCTSGWFYFFYVDGSGAPLPDKTYTVTVTQTSPPSGCSGGLAAPYTFTFGPGRYAPVDMFYNCSTTPTVLDNPSTEPPPQPPPPHGQVLVQVTGNGTVAVAGSRRAPGGIRCGTGGFACYSQTAPQQQLTLAALPNPGYKFTGWSGACHGGGACTLKAGNSTSVAAQFLSKAPARVGFKVANPSLKAKWKASIGHGVLRVVGSVTTGASLRVELRRPGGAPLFAKTTGVAPGPFLVARALTKLANGARLFPGGFVVVVRGQAGSTILPLQIRTVTLNAPKEGVVRSTYASTSENGTPRATIPTGSPQAWVTFAFATQPRTGPITATWYGSKGELLGTATKSNRPTISTGVGSAHLMAGKLKVVLKAGGKIVAQRIVTVR